MRKLYNILKFIFTHPLSSKNKWAALKRFLKWQLGTRFFPVPVVFPFVGSSKLIVEKGMAGATGNIYAGLHEFEDMAFTLHVLRQNDLFADVGANIGSYTVLASAVAGSKSIAIEPVPSTFTHLKNNISINNIEQLVKLVNGGVGSANAKLQFTRDQDTVNHVITDGEDHENAIEVQVSTLDDICKDDIPLLVKMDVEGFELEALKGAQNILRNDGLQALIIELNGSCRRYGVTEQEIHQYILSFGFNPYSYEPFTRRLTRLKNYGEGNTIYIKNEKLLTEKINSSPKYKVFTSSI